MRGQGPGRQNHESAVAVPLRPGARDRPAEGARSRGRRFPIEGVLLLIALLARWRPDDEDQKQLLPVDAAKTGARGGQEEHAHVEYSGGNAGAAGGKVYLVPFSRRSPETEDVHKGPRDDVRAGKSAGASR